MDNYSREALQAMFAGYEVPPSERPRVPEPRIDSPPAEHGSGVLRELAELAHQWD